jgi:AraC-like DNA-binding protein
VDRTSGRTIVADSCPILSISRGSDAWLIDSEAMDELAALITRHAREGITATSIPRLTVMRSDNPTEPLGHVARPSLALVVGGAKAARLNDRRLYYGAGQYLVVGVDLPIVAHITEASPAAPFLGVGLDLHAAPIAALLLDAGPAPRAGERPPLGLAISDAHPALLDAMTRLLSLADEPTHAVALAPIYEREILWRLLTGPQGDLVRQIGLADSRLTHIAHAIRYVREHFSESIRIEQLAELAAMSPSSLHRHFRAVTDMTPIQFQKHLRLQEARSRLLAEPGDVAATGFAVGYESASQFNREYRRMFGAPPGRDARTQRAATGAPAPTLQLRRASRRGT